MKYSIIIPVYNNASYIRECISSVMGTDREIICVDDGSTDDTAVVLDAIAGIRVVHQKNQGVAAARNKGLSLASGEYIVFVDGDDLLSPGAFELFDHVIEQYPNADLISYRYKYFNDGTNAFDAEFDYEISDCKVIDVSQAISNEVCGRGFAENIYKRDVLIGLKFPSLSIGEDRCFYLSVIEKVNLIVDTGCFLYGYRQHEKSVMHSKADAQKMIDDVRHWKFVYQWASQSHKKLDDMLIRRMGLVASEFLAHDYWCYDRLSRRAIWPEWQGLIRLASTWTRFSCFRRMILKITFCPVLTLIFGYLPFWLKQHGVHR